MKILYVDGGCNNKIGIGAYAFVLIESTSNLIRCNIKHGEVIHSDCGKLHSCTNNIAELLAVYQGLRYSEDKHTINYIVTDSLYVQKGVTDWSLRWKLNNWKNATGNTIANYQIWRDLIKLWDRLNITNNIQLLHTRGHIGVYWNEQCDKLCTKCMQLT